jgi:ribonuclease HI
MLSLAASIQRVKLTKKKEEYPIQELARLAEMKIAEIDAEVEIFTDGSTSGQQMNGGAGVFVQDRNGNTLHEEARAAGELCSSYDGECVAILAAYEWIASRDSKETIAIFTDSQSMISALESNDWRNQHEWMRLLKKKISNSKRDITICWIPSHCGVYGNEKADRLAERGTKMNQSEAPVTFSVAKAKIRNKKWKIEHERAAEIFGERRKPRKIEKTWPSETRRTFARLRTNHAKELRHYRHRIGVDTAATCIFCEMDEDETIDHILCRCPQLEERRKRAWHEAVTVRMLADEPEVCRHILENRIPKLKLGRRSPEEEGGSPSDYTGQQA